MPGADPILNQCSRIVVLGTSGSGKTTLAARMAAKLDVPHIELDLLHHAPGWQVHADFAARVAERVAEPAWVCDGNYSKVRHVLWPRATAFVWLNYSFPVVFRRAVGRTVRRVWTQDEVFPGCRETFARAFLRSDSIPWWVLRTYRRRRRQYPALFSTPKYRDVPVFEMHSPEQAEELLGHL